MNLLLVDDEVFALEALKAAIDWKSLGIHEVFSCRSINAAKQIFSESAVDLLICDIEMPNGTGLELASWLSVHYPDTLILFLTCHSDFSFAKEAISYHAFAYLLKPFDKEELTKTVTDAIQLIEKRQNQAQISASFSSDQLLDLEYTRQQNRTEKEEAEKSTLLVKQILELIQENKALTREELASQVFLSPDYMAKIFKKETGKRISDYLSEVRLQEAKYLLTDTNQSISEIASSLAYSNFSSFSRMFKSETGYSPAAYRKKYRKS